jgi:hypothetical protein
MGGAMPFANVILQAGCRGSVARWRGVVEDAVICRSLKPESDALSNVGRERP